MIYWHVLNDKNLKISASKYHQMHGISHLSFNSKEEGLLISRIGNLPLINFWKKRVEKTFNTYRNYSEKRIIIQCFLFSFPLPFIYFDLMDWVRWFNGQKFYIHNFDPNHSIYAVFLHPFLKLLFFSSSLWKSFG